MKDSSKKTKKALDGLTGLHFLPLGGCGEIGMNANFYNCDGQWLMVDNGITFSRVPEGVLMTDIRAFLSEIHLDQLQGLVITHAHEDHVGAAAYLWPHLRCPMYATPFTACILKNKLKDAGHNCDMVREIPLEGGMQLGHFGIQFVSLTHSIPEPSALFIRTPHGNVFHTGDWKIDPDPLIGKAIEENVLKAIGDEGVLALVCDSTNVFEGGVSGSEGDVRKVIQEVVQQCKDSRVIISCFSSNLARIQSCYEAALATDRKVVLAGRSLQRMVDAAKTCGYWPEKNNFIDPEHIGNYAPHRLMVITTGSQAEPTAALTRMSMGTHPAIHLDKKDTVIFSSRVIPGNQDAISALQNRLVLKGVEIIKYREGLHVSGHPCQDELLQIYKWLKPKILVPVHGEDIHIREHALFGQRHGIPHNLRPHNGQLFCLSGGAPVHKGDVPTGRLALDGRRLVEDSGPVITERKELLGRGILAITLVVSRSRKSIISKMMLSHGVFEYPEERADMEELIKVKISEIFDQKLSEMESKPEEAVKPDKGFKTSRPRIAGLNAAVEKGVRELFRRQWGMKPVVRTVTAWVEDERSRVRHDRREGDRTSGKKTPQTS